MSRSGPACWLHSFSQYEIETIHAAALRVLAELGMEVTNPAARRRLAAAGAHIVDERAHFEPAFVEEQLASIRRAHGPECPRRHTGRVRLIVGDMPIYYLRPGAEAADLMTTADLVEVVKGVQSVRDWNVGGSVPGIPCDVPPRLQPLVTYRAGAEFSSEGGAVHTFHPPEMLAYLFRMAEAMGKPLQSWGVFPISPLRLVGPEFDAVVAHATRWRTLGAYSLPACGATGPIHWRAAWALSVAEAVGGAVTLHIVSGGKPVHIGVGMYAFDMRTMCVAGGAPEFAWIHWLGAQLTQRYDDAEYSGYLTTQAKFPGLQAGAEKAIGATFGVLTGCERLGYGGALSFDDIFSLEQMVADCELRDALEHVARGIPPEDPAGWLDEIREGANGSYIQTDTTLDHYRETYWLPQVFDRTTWPSFQYGKGRHGRERACDIVRTRLAGYSYCPPSGVEELRCVFHEAWRTLGGDPRADYLALLENG